jgi:hypothetical protein
MKLNTRLQRVVAAVTITVITIAVIGVALFATTPLGCGPAKAMHMKISSYRCTTVALISPNPSPSQSPTPGAKPWPSPNPEPASSNPYPQPASSNPYPQPGSGNPYPQPASGSPYPDAASGFPPFSYPASGGFPPGLALSCRLPIYAGGPGTGGFVAFPNGNFIADPRSAVSVPSPSPGGPTPQPQYGYSGWFGTWYDRAYSRWLPAPYRWVTPDGTRYAYPGRPDGIYVQNVTNGTQVELGEGTFWQVLDVDSAGVYAVTGSTGGLWRLTFSGTVTQIVSTGYWQAVGGGFAYGTPTAQVPQGATNTILRLDLRNGSTTEYFSVQSMQSSVPGMDGAGNPIIYVSGPNVFDVFIATAPYTATRIASLNGTNFWPNTPPIPDRHGLWFSGGNGIALYVQGVGWYKMSAIGGSLAGGCN